MRRNATFNIANYPKTLLLVLAVYGLGGVLVGHAFTPFVDPLHAGALGAAVLYFVVNATVMSLLDSSGHW